MAISAVDLQGMATHWLGCPPNGYLGSGYGSALQDLLQTPMSGPGADALITKLRGDIPVMGDLPASALNIFASTDSADRMHLILEIAGIDVPLELPNKG